MFIFTLKINFFCIKLKIVFNSPMCDINLQKITTYNDFINFLFSLGGQLYSIDDTMQDSSISMSGRIFPLSISQSGDSVTEEGLNEGSDYFQQVEKMKVIDNY